MSLVSRIGLATADIAVRVRRGEVPRNMASAGNMKAINATIHRTEGGIPHVIASDWGNLGYGQAYATSESHFCALARNMPIRCSERRPLLHCG